MAVSVSCCGSGTPDRARTYNLRLRRPTLYPVELRAHRVSEPATRRYYQPPPAAPLPDRRTPERRPEEVGRGAEAEHHEAEEERVRVHRLAGGESPPHERPRTARTPPGCRRRWRPLRPIRGSRSRIHCRAQLVTRIARSTRTSRTATFMAAPRGGITSPAATLSPAASPLSLYEAARKHRRRGNPGAIVRPHRVCFQGDCHASIHRRCRTRGARSGRGRLGPDVDGAEERGRLPREEGRHDAARRRAARQEDGLHVQGLRDRVLRERRRARGAARRLQGRPRRSSSSSCRPGTSTRRSSSGSCAT